MGRKRERERERKREEKSMLHIKSFLSKSNMQITCMLTTTRYLCYIHVLAGLVGRGVTVSDGCVIGAACEVVSNERMPPDTIIYGSDCRRYTKSTPPQVIITFTPVPLTP